MVIISFYDADNSNSDAMITVCYLDFLFNTVILQVLTSSRQFLVSKINYC